MRRALNRLRWQLTLSHLAAIAFTLVSMIAAILIIASAGIAFHSSPINEPAQDAQMIAGSIDGLVVHSQSGSDSAELSNVLASLVSGDLRILAGPEAFAPEPARRFIPFSTSLHNLAYIAVIGRDGKVIGSSDPSGSAFAPPERSEWNSLINAALSGQRDPRYLVATRSGAGPAALGAYPIVDGRGQVIAMALVAKSELSSTNLFANFLRTLVFFSAATIVILAGAFFFALASSMLVGYLLARRLVRRLELLGQAAQGLAAGDLSRRAEEGPADEVGQLTRQFNDMAERLAHSLTELEAEKRHAEAALQAKRELVANVSHELRTPLSSIRGHTESLLMRDIGLNGSDRREYLDVIHRETKQLSRLIDDLFMLSTAEAGALPLSLQPVVLGEVVDEVASSIRSVALNERRVTIITQVEPALSPVLADRQRVAQVLANLVRNAVRHTPEGGLISVRASNRGGFAAVAVEDTGVGIPSDQLSHVFERFYRGDAARDRASGGAGLGLAIVRELVEAMGGEVSVESVVGQGSCFSFTLPFADNNVARPGAQAGRGKS